MGKVKGSLYASDLSQDAASLVEKNAKNLSIPVVSRFGSVFEPWAGESFDYIVDDISGVSEKIADISPWFDKVSCRSGKDGIDLVVEVIKKSPLHLIDGGKLFFPTLSLSNSKKILAVAEDTYQNLEKISSQQWRIPDELLEHKDLLFDLRENEHINFEEKYGWLLFSTEVFVAQNPK